MDTHWTSDSSIYADSNPGPGHDVEQDNLASQISGNMTPSWQSLASGLDDSWQTDPHFATSAPLQGYPLSPSHEPNIRSHFHGHPHLPLGNHDYQAPDTSFEGLSDSNVTDARTHLLLSGAILTLPVSSADPHHHPGLRPQHHHAQTVSLLSPQLDPASTTIIDTGHSLSDDFDNKRERHGGNVGTMPSCERVPVAGPSSVAAAQEQNTVEQDVSPKREQQARGKQEKERKLREKKERDKNRKRAERSDNTQDYEKICTLLDISLTPKKTLANRILHAVEALVGQRKRDDELQHRLQRTEAGAEVLKTHTVNCKCSQ